MILNPPIQIHAGSYYVGGNPPGSDNRIWRGGGWQSSASNCEVSFRISDHPLSEGDMFGFRLVRNK